MQPLHILQHALTPHVPLCCLLDTCVEGVWAKRLCITCSTTSNQQHQPAFVCCAPYIGQETHHSASTLLLLAPCRCCRGGNSCWGPGRHQGSTHQGAAGSLQACCVWQGWSAFVFVVGLSGQLYHFQLHVAPLFTRLAPGGGIWAMHYRATALIQVAC